ncbi:MAG: TetR/AcrR family transcriptional regulator [Bryobacteraceae bacterium]
MHARTSRAAKKPSTTAAGRDRAILKAALQEFTRSGFAAARMEDIARKAGVAKGTIYLRFKDKEALFEAIVRGEISPLVSSATAPPEPGEPIRVFLERTIIPLVSEPGRSRRTAVIRLLIGEASRFPKLAEFYYRTIIEPGLAAFGRLAQQAFATGELSTDAALRYPHLLVAPAIVGLLWSGLFDRFCPIDLEDMVRAHFKVLFAGQSREAKRTARKG